MSRIKNKEELYKNSIIEFKFLLNNYVHYFIINLVLTQYSYHKK